MKILMITHDTKIDRRIIQEAKTLIKNGYSVKIIAFPWDGDEDKDIDIEIIRPKITHVQREKRKKTFYLYSILKKYLPTRVINKVRGIYDSLVIDFENHFESYVLELALKEEADIYHVHDLPCLSTAYKVSQKYRGKLIYDSHEYFVEQGIPYINKKKWENIERKYIKFTDEVITVNDSIAIALQKKYDIKKPYVIMNKVDMVVEDLDEELRKNIRKQYGIMPDEKVLLFQGGLSKSRSIEKILNITKLCKTKFKLVFLGNGEYKNFLKNESANMDNVVFIDEVEQKLLSQYTMAIGDLGIIPYEGYCLNNYFCTPNKLFEFIACGLPIISNDLPEIRKVIDGEGIGALIDINDYKKSAEVIDDIFGNDDKYMEYKLNLSKVASKYSWDFESHTLIEIYNNL